MQQMPIAELSRPSQYNPPARQRGQERRAEEAIRRNSIILDDSAADQQVERSSNVRTSSWRPRALPTIA